MMTFALYIYIISGDEYLCNLQYTQFTYDFFISYAHRTFFVQQKQLIFLRIKNRTTPNGAARFNCFSKT